MCKAQVQFQSASFGIGTAFHTGDVIHVNAVYQHFEVLSLVRACLHTTQPTVPYLRCDN
jgi:hypothetical protein